MVSDPISSSVTPYYFTKEIQGHEIFYVQSYPKSPPQNETVLVFIHPIALQHKVWKYQWEYFSPKYSLLAMDLPCFGSSSHKSGMDTTPSYFQSIVADFLNSLRLSSIILIGSSLGGAIALSLYPKLAKKIRGIILSSALSIDGLQTGLFKRFSGLIDKYPLVRNASSIVAPFAPVKTIIRILFGMTFEKSMSALKKEGYKKYLEEYYRDGRATYNLFNVLRFFNEWDILEEILPKIDVPVLICWGENDQILPIVSGKKLRKKISASSFVSFPDTGHMPYLERPQEFNHVLENFLSENKKKFKLSKSFFNVMVSKKTYFSS